MSDTYNPRTGQYGGAPFAHTALADKLRQLRDYIHSSAGPTASMSSIMPLLGSLGGPMLGAINGATQGDLMTNHHGFFNKIQEAEDAAKAAPTGPAGPTPPISGISPGYQDAPMSNPVQPTQPMPPVQGFDMTTGVPMPRPRPMMPPQASPVPMPQARPAAAPQAQPDTSFFMRNALSMRDPATNQLIDPSGASQVRGPDLINKMMGYLHNKDMG